MSPIEKFEYQFSEIAKNKRSDLDPEYGEETEKLSRGILLTKKGHLGQALGMFLTSICRLLDRLINR